MQAHTCCMHTQYFLRSEDNKQALIEKDLSSCPKQHFGIKIWEFTRAMGLKNERNT